jgi:hypothetical protein
VMTGIPRLVVSRRVAFPVQPTPVSRWKYRHAAITISPCRGSGAADAGGCGHRATADYGGV